MVFELAMMYLPIALFIVLFLLVSVTGYAGGNALDRFLGVGGAGVGGGSFSR